MAFANGHNPMDMGPDEEDERAAWLTGRYTKLVRPCRLCDGYYGPNFNEPVCATCHSFVYPRSPDGEDEFVPEDPVCKPEDDDSGNEEPEADEPLISPAKAQNWVNGHASHPAGSNNVIVPAKRKRSDSLAEQIQLLTCPRPLPLSKRYANQIPVLPPEVWTKVFSFLDDFSLWSVGQICQSWRSMLELGSAESNAMWRNSIARRWPVVSTLRRVTERATVGTDFWWRLYNALAESVPCKSCLYQMVPPEDEENGDSNPGTPPNGAYGGPSVGDSYRDEAWRSTRLRMEMKILAYEETEGINAVPLKDGSVWQASLVGPRGSPYENGIFYLMIKLPKVYPLKPPLVRFLTKIFHPNVSRHGDIGIDCIRHNWTVALSISTILLSIQSIFTDPYTHVCMEPSIGKLYNENYPLFQEIARDWTRRFASHHSTIVIPPVNQQPAANPNPNQNLPQNGDDDEAESDN